MKTTPARPPTILLLTTDPRVVCQVRAAAVQEGYEVRLLQDAIVAYYHIRGKREDIDLVMIDLDPEMQAVALLSVTLRRMPVVVLTSVPVACMAEAFRYDGTLHCVTKPFGARDLTAVIEQALAPAAIAV